MVYYLPKNFFTFGIRAIRPIMKLMINTIIDKTIKLISVYLPKANMNTSSKKYIIDITNVITPTCFILIIILEKA